MVVTVVVRAPIPLKFRLEATENGETPYAGNLAVECAAARQAESPLMAEMRGPQSGRAERCARLCGRYGSGSRTRNSDNDRRRRKSDRAPSESGPHANMAADRYRNGPRNRRNRIRQLSKIFTFMPVPRRQVIVSWQIVLLVYLTLALIAHRSAWLAGQRRASRIRLKGVSAARRKRVNPALRNTSASRASPACAPRTRFPPSEMAWAQQSVVEAA